MGPAQVFKEGMRKQTQNHPENPPQEILLLICYQASSTCLSRGFQKERDSQPVDPTGLRGVPSMWIHGVALLPAGRVGEDNR